MSAILTAKGLAAGHADRLLFSGLDLVIAPGEITGLVGANGAGKSTLLRILAGLVQPDQGEVGLSPPAATVGYLSQEPERRPGESINGFIARRTGVARAQQDLDEATALLVQEKPGADDAYARTADQQLRIAVLLRRHVHPDRRLGDDGYRHADPVASAGASIRRAHS